MAIHNNIVFTFFMIKASIQCTFSSVIVFQLDVEFGQVTPILRSNYAQLKAESAWCQTSHLT